LKFPAADIILAGQELHGFAALRAHMRRRILWHDDHAGSAASHPTHCHHYGEDGMVMKELYDGSISSSVRFPTQAKSSAAAMPILTEKLP
jgi:hypothetical protein